MKQILKCIKHSTARQMRKKSHKKRDKLTNKPTTDEEKQIINLNPATANSISIAGKV
jgi:hypothetical protein